MKFIVSLILFTTLSSCALLQARHHQSENRLDINCIEVSNLLFAKAKTNWAQKYTSEQDRVTVKRQALDDNTIEISAIRWSLELTGTVLPFITLRVSSEDEGAVVKILEQRSMINQDHIYLDQVESWITEINQGRNS